MQAGHDVIVFDLECGERHRFEGWFACGAEFERQLERKLIGCPVCGDSRIVRVPHAAHVRTGPRQEDAGAAGPPANRGHYVNLEGNVLPRLIEHVIRNSEDVGAAFPEEARKIHYQEAPERRIRGTASTEEVDALREEGIEVVALPIPAYRMGKTH